MAYSCGNGDEYHVCISYLPNSIHGGNLPWDGRTLEPVVFWFGVAGNGGTDTEDVTGCVQDNCVDDNNDGVEVDDNTADVVVTGTGVVSVSASGLGTLSGLISLLPCCSAHSCKPAVSSCHPKLGH